MLKEQTKRDLGVRGFAYPERGTYRGKVRAMPKSLIKGGKLGWVGYPSTAMRYFLAASPN